MDWKAELKELIGEQRLEKLWLKRESRDCKGKNVVEMKNRVWETLFY